MFEQFSGPRRAARTMVELGKNSLLNCVNWLGREKAALVEEPLSTAKWPTMVLSKEEVDLFVSEMHKAQRQDAIEVELQAILKDHEA